ncbi:hypothetical protein M0R04_04810 [Candidatus Dojkabacteria bacterium]|jgi:hypothetical protein|nr:hypothetical protein [Candidatus Dojkabacteria bacterium]
MADIFRKTLDSLCCVGGVHCNCSTGCRGKDRAILNRLARTKIKQQDQKEFKEVVKEDE